MASAPPARFRRRERSGPVPARLLAPVTRLLMAALVGTLRRFGPVACSNLGGRIARLLGPLLPVSRIADRHLSDVLPELDACHGCEQPPQFHRVIASSRHRRHVGQPRPQHSGTAASGLVRPHGVGTGLGGGRRAASGRAAGRRRGGAVLFRPSRQLGDGDPDRRGARDHGGRLLPCIVQPGGGPGDPGHAAGRARERRVDVRQGCLGRAPPCRISAVAARSASWQTRR